MATGGRSATKVFENNLRHLKFTTLLGEERTYYNLAMYLYTTCNLEKEEFETTKNKSHLSNHERGTQLGELLLSKIRDRPYYLYTICDVFKVLENPELTKYAHDMLKELHSSTPDPQPSFSSDEQVVKVTRKDIATAEPPITDHKKHRIEEDDEDTDDSLHLNSDSESSSSNESNEKADNEAAIKIRMEEGSVSLNNIKMVICGPPAVGKTAFKDLLLNNPPPLKHHSTAIAARPVQAIERIAAGEKVWEKLTNNDLLEILHEAIQKGEKSIQSIPTSHGSSIIVSNPQEAVNAVTDVTILQPTTKIDYIFLQKIIAKIASFHKKVSQKLLDATWIHLLDSGGQPQFTDLLRMFVRDNSLYIIVMKATESLDDKPTSVYSINGKPVSARKEMTMTNLQIIENFVRSVVATSRDKAKHSKPAFAIVVTHCDLVEEIQEKVSKKNEVLQHCLSEFHDLFIFYNRDTNELIFPVDNLCQHNREKISADIRSCLLSSRSHISLNFSIPIRWYVFDLCIKEEASKETHGMISQQSCYDIGRKLNMVKAEVDECLKHLDSMRLCIYYPHVLPHVVFTSPQFLIDCLSNIVRVSFVDDLQQILPEGVSLSDEVIQLLKRDGVFDEPLLDSLELTFFPNLFMKSDLLMLLQHFRLISPMKAATPQYFMPTLLPAKRLTKEQKIWFSKSVAPLVVMFGTKLVPQGLFPALIVSLLSRQEESTFFIDSGFDTFPRQFRHVVKLYSDDLFGSVFLCEEYNSVEVYFTGPRQHCCLLRKVILECLSASVEALGYDKKTLGIFANVCCNRKHMIPEHDVKPHPISISHNVNPPAIGCSIENDLPVTTMNNIHESQRCWLIESNVSVVTSNTLPADTTAVLDQTHVPVILEAVKEVVLTWELLGTHLGLEDRVLQEIKHNCHHQVQVCRKDMINCWIETEVATRDNLIAALEAIDRYDIAAKVKCLPSVN